MGFMSNFDYLINIAKKYKNVDEFIKKQEEKVINKEGFANVGDYIELYHGTNSRRAKKIADEGFRIRAVKNQTMGGDPESSRNYIWFAKEPEHAKSYAEMHANPKVITVRIPKDVFERLDRNGFNSGPVSFWSKEEIPSEYIYNPEQAKSQLTDIWNKAHGKLSLPLGIMGAGIASQAYATPTPEQEALQEPTFDPTTLLAGPARWGGGLMNMGIDTAMRYLTK